MSQELRNLPWTYFRTISVFDYDSHQDLSNLSTDVSSAMLGLESAVRSNTQAVLDTGEQNARLLQQVATQQAITNRALVSIESASWLANSHLEGIGMGIGALNDSAREGNTLLLGIAKMLAAAHHIDASEILPDYFPKTLGPYKMHFEKIKTMQAKLDTYALALLKYREFFGAERVDPLARKFRDILTSDPKATVNPEGLIESLILNLVQKGRQTYAELQPNVARYVADQTKIESLYADPSAVSKIESTLRDVNDVLWRGKGKIEPVAVNINYAQVPGLDNVVTTGYTLSALRKPGITARLLVTNARILVLKEFGRASERVEKYRPWGGIDVIDGDWHKDFPVKQRLAISSTPRMCKITSYESDIFTYLSIYSTPGVYEDMAYVGEGKPMIHNSLLEFGNSIYAGVAESTEKLLGVIQESQEKRMIEGILPK